MLKTTIEGTISPEGYVHVQYDMQVVDGMPLSPYDIVITPKDEDGAISFTLPQGINVTIGLYETMGHDAGIKKTVTIPRSDRVALSELLK